jgi:hypothetical protein
MNFEEFLMIIEKYGLKSTAIITFLFLLVRFAKNKWGIWIIQKISDKLSIFTKNKNETKNIRMIKESDILNHEIFNYIDFWVSSRIPTIEFSTEYRTIVFRRYLTIYLTNYKSKIYSFLNSKKYQEMDNSEVNQSLLQLINNIIDSYEKEMIDDGIPKYIINKMKCKNDNMVTLTMDLIDNVCNSKFYESDKNFLKVYSILNILLSILENAITESKLVCESINGHLKGFRFRDGDSEVIEP